MTQGMPRFTLPTARFGSEVVQIAPNNMKSGINLSELVKSRMKKDETESASGSDEETSAGGAGCQISLIPKLSDLSINSDSGIASSSPAESLFSNLTDLARHHLQSKGETPIGSPLASKSGGFLVPNIFNTPSSGPPPGFAPNVTRKPQTPLGKKEWIVDLKSALIKDKSEITPHHRKAVRLSGQDENDDPINYGFIDCDIVESKPVIDEFCLIDASGIMNRKLRNCTAISSAFGSILCVRYRKRNQVHVRHGFVSKPGVVPFRFNVPSPDDVVLEHMKKFRR